MTNSIPDFRSDGFLPEGIHRATLAEITFRFGTSSRKRRSLVMRLRHWVDLAQQVEGCRLAVDGSFVTAKSEPRDVDAIIFLPANFNDLVEQGSEAAIELEAICGTRTPPDLFPVADDVGWSEWCEFFGRIRGTNEVRKGFVEVIL